MSHGQERFDGSRQRWVYFARLDISELVPYYGRNRMVSLIKIGTSLYPANRMAGLRAAYHTPATLLACYPGGYDEERSLHERFQNSRLAPAYNNIEGELFYPTRDLMEFIEKIREEEQKRA